MSEHATAAPRQERPGNDAGRLRWRRPAGRGLAAAGSGLWLTLAFAPVEWSLVAWVGLVPILFLGLRRRAHPFLLGVVFGAAHFVTSLYWLYPVFLAAPVGMALYCLLFPAVWLWACRALWQGLCYAPAEDVLPAAALPPARPTRVGEFLFAVGCAALWVATEWCRSWLLTGFPWNLIAVSQWEHIRLLRLTRFTGIYGLSFLIVLVNAGFFLFLHALRQRQVRPRRLRDVMPYPLATVVALVVLACWIPPAPWPQTDRAVRVAVVQGGLEQMRVPSEAQLQRAIDVYSRLTLEVVEREQPDLVVWPETALPMYMTDEHGQAGRLLRQILARTRTPMMLGTIEERPQPAPPADAADAVPASASFNSLVLFDGGGQRLEHFDKIHIVPFGEYLPLKELWPGPFRRWYRRVMARDLTPGREHTVIAFKGLRFAPAICYEDVFPEISRGGVLKGANALITITNDAWYAETAGAHQHMTHAVFRAAETCRPMLRAGNNACSCLIMPDGRIVGQLKDPRTGSPFYSGYHVYAVPVADDPPVTFYTRYGNVFAWFALALSATALLYCLYRFLVRKRWLHTRTMPPAAPAGDARDDAVADSDAG